jgi:hypothetical protein
MKMVRVVLDLPYDTKLSALQKLADEQGCTLFRRADGTFAIRPQQPRLQPVSMGAPA